MEALGERKFRDIIGILPQPGHLRDKVQNSGTVPAIPGRLATMGSVVGSVFQLVVESVGRSVVRSVVWNQFLGSENLRTIYGSSA